MCVVTSGRGTSAGGAAARGPHEAALLLRSPMNTGSTLNTSGSSLFLNLKGWRTIARQRPGVVGMPYTAVRMGGRASGPWGAGRRGWMGGGQGGRLHDLHRCQRTPAVAARTRDVGKAAAVKGVDGVAHELRAVKVGVLRAQAALARACGVWRGDGAARRGSDNMCAWGGLKRHKGSHTASLHAPPPPPAQQSPAPSAPHPWARRLGSPSPPSRLDACLQPGEGSEGGGGGAGACECEQPP